MCWNSSTWAWLEAPHFLVKTPGIRTPKKKTLTAERLERVVVVTISPCHSGACICFDSRSYCRVNFYYIWSSSFHFTGLQTGSNTDSLRSGLVGFGKDGQDLAVDDPSCVAHGRANGNHLLLRRRCPTNAGTHGYPQIIQSLDYVCYV